MPCTILAFDIGRTAEFTECKYFLNLGATRQRNVVLCIFFFLFFYYYYHLVGQLQIALQDRVEEFRAPQVVLSILMNHKSEKKLHCIS